MAGPLGTPEGGKGPSLPNVLRSALVLRPLGCCLRPQSEKQRVAGRGFQVSM